MARKHMFVTDGNGKSREVKVDPKHQDRQARDHRAAGREVTVLSEDERIKYGHLAQQIARNNR